MTGKGPTVTLAEHYISHFLETDSTKVNEEKLAE
jgi:hypothetical protein